MEKILLDRIPLNGEGLNPVEILLGVGACGWGTQWKICTLHFWRGDSAGFRVCTPLSPRLFEKWRAESKSAKFPLGPLTWIRTTPATPSASSTIGD